MSMMPIIRTGIRWVLVLGYVLLVLTLQPLLLEHTFAEGTAQEHSDQDVCAWLDHAASAGLQSATPAPTFLAHIIVALFPHEFMVLSIDRSFDSVRGPPFSLS